MNKKHFLAAMYLRLSRDDSDVGDVTDKDGRLKSESNSIGNQRELIRAFIHEQQDIELYDIYVDDGFSGSNFDRPEFKRMISDIEAGKVNCVILVLGVTILNPGDIYKKSSRLFLCVLLHLQTIMTAFMRM